MPNRKVSFYFYIQLAKSKLSFGIFLSFFLSVQKLQCEINLERQRLEELRSNLEREREMNTELVQKIRVQSKAVCNMQVERDIMKKRNSQNEDKLHKIL